MVKHVIPSSLQEALIHLETGTFKIIAGGTDMMIQRRSPAGIAANFNADMIYLFNLPELKYIKQEHGFIKIGSMTPLEDILHHPLTPRALKTIIGEMAAPGIRHLATIAGNIANASPAGDSLVGLYVLDAEIVLMSSKRARVVPIQDVIVGVRKTTIAQDELIAEIKIPVCSFDQIAWKKVGGRLADAISKVSFLGVASFHDDVVSDFRVGFGAVAPVVIRSKTIEQTIIGKRKSEITKDLQHILDVYRPLITPIDDQRSNAKYRAKVAINLLKDMIEKIG